MPLPTSERLQYVEPSATLVIASKAQHLISQGENIISLSSGEPDFDTPVHICQAAIEAINSGKTKYTNVAGVLALRQAICNKLWRDNKLKFEPNEIIASTGAKQAIFNAVQAILNPGDEAIILSPYWVSYKDIVVLANGIPRIIQSTATNNFKVSPQQLASSVNDKTKLIFINSPCNPTGSVYTKQELMQIADILLQYPDVWVISDDIYEYILWGEEPFSNILMVCPELRERCIIINGVSKSYAMTGWRIGYAAGPAHIIAAMDTIQSQSTSNPCSIAQYAAIAAIDTPRHQIAAMVSEFKQRQAYLYPAVNNIPGLKCVNSQGAFYAFVDCGELIDKLENISNDVELAEQLLQQAKIALVPGSAFGMRNFIRISYATDLNTLSRALKQLNDTICSWLA